MDHWLARAAAMHPERPAVARLTYAALYDSALRFAGGLRERGIVTGDRVGLALPSGEEFAIALHGCLLAGGVAVPIDLRLNEAERAARTADARVVVDDAVVVLDEARVVFDEARVVPHEGRAGQPARLVGEAGVEPPDLAAVATLMHTSGTTAAPRQVPLTYGNWLANALGSAVALGLDPQERWLCPMPLAHVGGLSILIRSAIYGTTAVLHERFDADAVAAALSDPGERITIVSLVPTMLGRLLDAGLSDPPTLRWALLGGGPIPPALLDRARDAGVPVAPTYGMTEACSQIATNGWPLPGIDLRIADDGEVLVRGPNVSAGARSADGWLHTADLGVLDDRGRLRITGRKAETIVTGGENVSPVEVEAALLEHPAVADAAVHARHDAGWGEALVATVVLRDGTRVGADELRAHCASLLAAFKVPKQIAFADRLPRTASGKLLRRELS